MTAEQASPHEDADGHSAPAQIHDLGGQPSSANPVAERSVSRVNGFAAMGWASPFAHEPVAAALRKTTGPLCNPAGAGSAIASLRTEEKLLCLVRLTGLRAGGNVPDAKANSGWMQLGERTAGRRRVRPFPGEGLQVTIGEEEANGISGHTAEAFGPPVAAHAAQQPAPHHA
ncbi:hypothetical protein [Streptomyces sp. LN549]|uniref:hypothetical protein n=1 Tax=Streptomyces sp. LN549 TaxID=3112979 RepID=UPI00371FA549